jgi:exopolysaccharide production protein ExoY
MSTASTDVGREAQDPSAIYEIRGCGIPAAGSFYARFGKPLLDVLVVLLLAPVALPLVGVAVVVLLFQGGAPIYGQERVGRNGRTFRMWKLRSMVRDADALLEAHLAASPEARGQWNEKQKLLDDPRITPFGRFLRKTSLDELPQLWNVIAGDMSIVGPRPMMVCQRPLYPGRAYYLLRPGITGPWQVSDRNRTSFAARAAFDHDYLQGLSLWRDLGILCRTVPAVFRGTGC